MRKIEILAPAGSYESLIAGIQAGADAVYIGGNQFGARANANNLSEEMMLQAIDYVHLHNKKMYLTVNTLLKNQELKEELYQYLSPLYRQGLDAVIVQDVGVMHFIHEYFPLLPIHASTQMTITMAEGASVFKELGVTRLVNSRELSLEEIKELCKSTELEVESFVHGALCYCYSGQCLMSSMLGGRSGNRGRCAQPCRMPYILKKDGAILSNKQEPFLLSPKDICTLDMIPQLIEAGIDSFKIEGRMKRPEYTALTAATYRKYVDLYLELGSQSYEKYIGTHQKEYQKDLENLMDLYNRGEFTNGYYKQHNGKDMMSLGRPNHNGVYVGKVEALKGDRAVISLFADISGQDVLEFRNKNHEVLYEYTVKEDASKGQLVETNFKHGSKIKVGDLVYRTKNQVLLEDIHQNYLQTEIKESVNGIFVAKIGEPLRLQLYAGETFAQVTGDVVESAKNQPITQEKVKNQLNKTNTTSFFFETLEIEMDENIFIPVGKLNEVRRSGMEELEKQLLKPYRRELDTITKSKYPVFNLQDQERGIQVHVKNLEQLAVAIQRKEVDQICVGIDNLHRKEIEQAVCLLKNKGKKLYFVLPAIFRKEAYMMWEKILQKDPNLFFGKEIYGFVIKNFEEYEFLQRHLKTLPEKKEIILDYNMYVFNEEAKLFWKGLGVHHFTSPVELNNSEIMDLGCHDMDFLVYGYLPLMTSAQCLVKNTIGCTKKSERYHLQDRYNKEFLCLNHCQYCYNIIYNSKPISLLKYKEDISKLKPRNIRLDFTIESKREMEEVLDTYIDVFCNNKTDKERNLIDYTKGHFKKGVE